MGASISVAKNQFLLIEIHFSVVEVQLSLMLIEFHSKNKIEMYIHANFNCKCLVFFFKFYIKYRKFILL